MADASARDVALWMKTELEKEGILYQQDVAYKIEDEFGGRHVYTNDNGNLSIGRAVLKEFRNITEGEIVWVRSMQYWRYREDNDESGRMSDY